jgi:hypothetical protein
MFLFLILALTHSGAHEISKQVSAKARSGTHPILATTIIRTSFLIAMVEVVEVHFDIVQHVRVGAQMLPMDTRIIAMIDKTR